MDNKSFMIEKRLKKIFGKIYINFHYLRAKGKDYEPPKNLVQKIIY